MADSSSQPSVGEFIAGIEWSMVDRPEEVPFDETSSKTARVSQSRVDSTDVSKVTVDRGRMARSFRSFLSAISFRGKMTHEIVEAEKITGGVLIVFEDGRSAIYSTVLLHALLPKAQPVIDALGPEE
jgi:predicted RNA-binding protein YlqC (UPF0109 family)